ncbi:MAG TPA: hypothetical protein PLP34_07245 [Chitinophagaceae bacterium]|nr:hypothetical protein [Chitinophagaceae bacterium]
MRRTINHFTLLILMYSLLVCLLMKPQKIRKFESYTQSPSLSGSEKGGAGYQSSRSPVLVSRRNEQ